MKCRAQCKVYPEQRPIVRQSALVELVASDNPNFIGRMPLPVRTTPVIRIDTIGYYIVEFETHNTIYEVV